MSTSLDWKWIPKVASSLHFKIFLWFCFVSIVVRTVVVVTIAIHSQPIEHPWMTGVLNSYARHAVDAYLNDGKPGLTRFLDEIEKSSRVKATLLDPESHDVSGRGVPPNAGDVLDEARSLGQSLFRTGRHWRGASVIPTEKGNYVFVAEILPPPGSIVQTQLIRWTALLFGGLLCLILARHITSPIRSLQGVARQIADGDLSVRALGAISPRNDELADLARDFDRMADRIQGLLNKQRELLGDISHELRSPLTRLGVSLELLRRGDYDALERIQTDIDRLNGLIQEILTMTRLEMHPSQNTDSRVNFRRIVESVAEDAAFEGRGLGKSVVITYADDCWMKGNPALLRSCLENVVRNAVYHTSPQTRVSISLKLSGQWVDVSVADQGNGVPAETLSRLFEPFYRVPGAEQHNGGTGLGLSIAHRVVQLYGGSIVARNREAGGLEMLIRVPASAPSA